MKNGETGKFGPLGVNPPPKKNFGPERFCPKKCPRKVKALFGGKKGAPLKLKAQWEKSLSGKWGFPQVPCCEKIKVLGLP